MAVVASLKMLSVGPIAFPVDVLSTIPTPQSLKTVCCGVDEPHAPTGITQPITCTHCGVVNDKTALRKAAKAGNEWILVDEVAAAELKEKVDNRKISLSVHPKQDFQSATVAGGKTYWLRPSKNTDSSGYSLFRQIIANDSDRAYVTVWAVRSKPAIYELTVYGNALMLAERVHVDDANPAPSVVGEAGEADVKNMELFIGSKVVPFRKEDYTDDSLSQLLASGQRVVLDGESPAEPVNKLSDLLAAMANELAKPETPKAARKPRAPRKPKIVPAESEVA